MFFKCLSNGLLESNSYIVADNKEAVLIEAGVGTEFIEKIVKEKDIEMVVQKNDAKTMENNIDSIIQLALIGGILAIFILWIFLKNIRMVNLYREV